MPPGVERDDRLVVHDEVLALDGPAQLGLEREQPHRVPVHLLVEDLVPGPTRRLGPVHGDVGVAQDVLRPARFRARQRDADARR